MAYLEDWQAAKEKFETDTGLKKPTAKGKFLFVSWRKPSGIEDTLKDIDKIVGGLGPNAPEDKTFKKWEDLNTTLGKKAAAYLKTLEEAIKNEKDESGKSDQYRQMKILKASLGAIVARVDQFYKDKFGYWQAVKRKGGQGLDKFDAILRSLKMLGTNLKSGVAKGTLFCKEVLGNPTADNWNRINTDDGARSCSQNISNIVKFVYADYVDLLVKGTKAAQETLEILDNEEVSDHIRKLNLFLSGMEGDITQLGTQTGGSPADGSLAFLANSANSHLPGTASKVEIVAAVKRFAAMVKKCSEISVQLIRFGS